ncbi:tryptophan synthase subunit beta [Kosakonia radicincitans DSM 16656]|uniref:hypothetical protein n=1 Tax=Kosakonia TaxID=1330547 RepID=UPI000273086B|nr:MULTISPECIES: hypothetical protein [Kosakonia]APG17366.1 tryptophan synthase subunit beta [Kosakonia radicincitans]ARD61741.1 tryptophan synthase subunit beta [Kosakonia radicincitans DSM 16656]KDE37615.1 tryptophan synthase subunit beta [Kosakonia radicincitans UMEnt01/12]MDD7996321.1 tryptophan synthase subunit beta [Kosakonia radicincitans]PTA93308.1 tryptophan synthase subunit beta [Kosakonia sp. H7A]
MHYIERDAEGRITRVESSPFAGMVEQREEDTQEITEWIRIHAMHQETLKRLQQSDLEMVRVLEDLIEVLMSKGIISITDLPQAAQSKLINRTQARLTLSGLERLIDDEDEGIF